MNQLKELEDSSKEAKTVFKMQYNKKKKKNHLQSSGNKRHKAIKTRSQKVEKPGIQLRRLEDSVTVDKQKSGSCQTAGNLFNLNRTYIVIPESQC